MFGYDVVIALALLAAAAGGYFLFQQLRRKPQPIVEPVVEAPPPPAPPPPPEPEPEIGNVRPEKVEWDQELALEGAYLFPQRLAPVTPYEDFNRRLFVFTPASTKPLKDNKLPLRAIDDHPIRVSCDEQTLIRAVRTELRCAYFVIVDRLGWFAIASKALERNPYATNAVIECYLAIPEISRPVVISYVEADKKINALKFMRHQFQDFDLPVSFLEPYPEQSFSYVLEQFLEARERWLWFSPARLRQHAAALNRSTEEAKARLQEVLSTNNFALLWKLRTDHRVESAPTETVATEPSQAAE